MRHSLQSLSSRFTGVNPAAVSVIVDVVFPKGKKKQGKLQCTNQQFPPKISYLLFILPEIKCDIPAANTIHIKANSVNQILKTHFFNGNSPFFALNGGASQGRPFRSP